MFSAAQMLLNWWLPVPINVLASKKAEEPTTLPTGLYTAFCPCVP
jgi:hypothetical protein